MSKFSIQTPLTIRDIGDEPVTVDRLKNYLQIEGTAYDSTLSNFISAARQMIENYCNISLRNHDIRAQIKSNTTKPFPLPMPPIDGVTFLAWRRCPSTLVDQVEGEDWVFVDDDADAKEVQPITNTGTFLIQYTTIADDREVFQQAILAQAGYSFNNRDSDKDNKMSPETKALIEAFRNHHY